MPVVYDKFQESLTLSIAKMWASSLPRLLYSLKEDSQECKCGSPPFNDFEDTCPVCTLRQSQELCDSVIAKLDKYQYLVQQVLPSLRLPPDSVNSIDTEPNYEECDE